MMMLLLLVAVGVVAVAVSVDAARAGRYQLRGADGTEGPVVTVNIAGFHHFNSTRKRMCFVLPNPETGACLFFCLCVLFVCSSITVLFL